MRNHRLLYAVFCVLFFKTASAQTIPLDTAVHMGVLPNGFTYYIRHNEEPKNRVFLYLVNNVGSVLEDSNQQGLAHFMEHMNFNGTTHFPKNELINYLQKSGVRFGADLNAYTDLMKQYISFPCRLMILQSSKTDFRSCGTGHKMPLSIQWKLIKKEVLYWKRKDLAGALQNEWKESICLCF